MSESEQQRRERAAQVHALGLRGSDAMAEVIAELEALGERQVVSMLRLATYDWRRAIARRCNELELGNTRVRKAAHPEYSEHVRRLRAEHAARDKPPLRLVQARDSVNRLRREARDAG